MCTQLVFRAAVPLISQSFLLLPLSHPGHAIRSICVQPLILGVVCVSSCQLDHSVKSLTQSPGGQVHHVMSFLQVPNLVSHPGHQVSEGQLVDVSEGTQVPNKYSMQGVVHEVRICGSSSKNCRAQLINHGGLHPSNLMFSIHGLIFHLFLSQLPHAVLAVEDVSHSVDGAS